MRPDAPRPRVSGRRALALALLAVTALLPGGCAKRDTTGIATSIRDALAHAHRDGETTAGRVARFYDHRGDSPAWLEADQLSADALALRNALATLPGDGLFGWEPDVARLDSLLESAPGKPGAKRLALTDAELARLDVRLTRAWLGAAHRLGHGVFPESQMEKSWRARDEGAPLEKRLAEALAHHAVVESLAACAPRDSDYVRLRTALAREVRAFQSSHALEATGVPDVTTRAAMDSDLVSLVHTVEVNLERHRWLRAPRKLPRIEVNIADATLAARADTGEVLRMRVVVGDVKHPTPIFSSAVQWMDVNPTWTLSRRVIAEEVVPGLKRHPDYFAAHEMIVMRPLHGKLTQVSPAGIVWDSVASDTFKTYVRQLAGDKNPLGRIRFMLPNRYEVYMHDTNQRGLFQRDDRARSHGCVRLQRPLDFAVWLRGLSKPIPLDTVRAAVRDTLARRWVVEPKVPVDILYWTAWVDEHGVLQRRRDLYGLDRRMLQAMATGKVDAFELNPPMKWDVDP